MIGRRTLVPWLNPSKDTSRPLPAPPPTAQPPPPPVPPPQRCHLCGSSSPAVRCEKCSNLIFCLSCDDMYHRHPKRRDHVRKLAQRPPVVNATPPPRPPPKITDLTTPPVPPPRRRKSQLSAPSSPVGPRKNEQKLIPELPKKQFPLKFGSLKKLLPNSNNTSNNSNNNSNFRAHPMHVQIRAPEFTHPAGDHRKGHLPFGRANTDDWSMQPMEPSSSEMDDEEEDGRSTGTSSGGPAPYLDEQWAHQTLPPRFGSATAASRSMATLERQSTGTLLRHHHSFNAPNNMTFAKQERGPYMYNHSASVMDLSYPHPQMGYPLPQVQSMSEGLDFSGGISPCGCRLHWIGPDHLGGWLPPVRCPMHSSTSAMFPSGAQPPWPYPPYLSSPSPPPPQLNKSMSPPLPNNTNNNHQRSRSSREKNGRQKHSSSEEDEPMDEDEIQMIKPKNNKKINKGRVVDVKDTKEVKKEVVKMEEVKMASTQMAGKDEEEVEEKQEDGGDWECEHCTFINEKDTRICAVCCKTKGLRDSPVPMEQEQTPEEPTVAPVPIVKKEPEGIYEEISTPKTKNHSDEIEQEPTKKGKTSPPAVKHMTSTGTSPPPQTISTQTEMWSSDEQEAEMEDEEEMLRSPSPVVSAAKRRIKNLKEEGSRLRRAASLQTVNRRSTIAGSRDNWQHDHIRRTASRASLRDTSSSPPPTGVSSGRQRRRSTQSRRRTSTLEHRTGYSSREEERGDDEYDFDDEDDKDDVNWSRGKSNKDYYLSMEELVERRRNKSAKSQGIEILRLVKEAEKTGFSADDLQVAMHQCGNKDPIGWLRDNWKTMVDTVATLASRKDNGVGNISAAEAATSLHHNKGNIWAAVSQCVDTRLRKAKELIRRSGQQLSRQEITAALTASGGNVERALQNVNKAAFSMKIYGPPVGVENESGAVRYSSLSNLNSIGSSKSPWSKQSSYSSEDEENVFDDEEVSNFDNGEVLFDDENFVLKKNYDGFYVHQSWKNGKFQPQVKVEELQNRNQKIDGIFAEIQNVKKAVNQNLKQDFRSLDANESAKHDEISVIPKEFEKLQMEQILNLSREQELQKLKEFSERLVNIPVLRENLITTESEIEVPKIENFVPLSEVVAPKVDTSSQLNVLSSVVSLGSENITAENKIGISKSDALSQISEVVSSKGEILVLEPAVSSQTKILPSNTAVLPVENEKLASKSQVSSSKHEILTAQAEVLSSKCDASPQKNKIVSPLSTKIDVSSQNSETVTLQSDILTPKTAIMSLQSVELDVNNQSSSPKDVLFQDSKVLSQKSDALSQNSDILSQESVYLSQKSENVSQKSENVSQKSENLSAKPAIMSSVTDKLVTKAEITTPKEVSSQKTEVSSQKSKKSELKNEISSSKTEIFIAKSEKLEPLYSKISDVEVSSKTDISQENKCLSLPTKNETHQTTVNEISISRKIGSEVSVVKFEYESEIPEEFAQQLEHDAYSQVQQAKIVADEIGMGTPENLKEISENLDLLCEDYESIGNTEQLNNHRTETDITEHIVIPTSSTDVLGIGEPDTSFEALIMHENSENSVPETEIRALLAEKEDDEEESMCFYDAFQDKIEDSPRSSLASDEVPLKMISDRHTTTLELTLQQPVKVENDSKSESPIIKSEVKPEVIVKTLFVRSGSCSVIRNRSESVSYESKPELVEVVELVDTSVFTQIAATNVHTEENFVNKYQIGPQIETLLAPETTKNLEAQGLSILSTDETDDSSVFQSSTSELDQTDENEEDEDDDENDGAAEPIEVPLPVKPDLARRARQYLAEGKLPNYYKAELAVKLLDLRFEESEAIFAANECSDLYMAVSYLQQDCELCAGKFPMGKMVSMLNCVHRCCRGCAKDYFTLKIKERNITEASCPFCNEPDLNDETIALEYFNNLDIMLKNLLEPNIHEIFQRKLRDRALMNEPNFRWCDKCGSGFITDPNRRRIMCPDCKTVTCGHCKKPWEKQHEGITCEQFEAWKQVNDPEYQSQGLEAYLIENGINCPKCKFKYDLAKGGCMHFTCTQCKFEFCSGCGRPFRMAGKCPISARCARLGLHAHHPRNCLFHLRDKEPEELKKLLAENNILYDEGDDLEVVPHRCAVMEQRENSDGNIDVKCGREVEPKMAGLCRRHYVEYLVSLVTSNGVDPVSIMDAAALEQELRRGNVEVPERKPGELPEEFRVVLLEVVLKKIPLEKHQVPYLGRRPSKSTLI